MTFDWYPWDRAAYKRKTLHLSLAEDGAYRRLIDEYMELGGALPDSDVALARIVGAALEEWLTLAPSVRAFFTSSNGRLIHKRCEQELDAQRILAASRSAHAKDAANARWNRERENKGLVRRAYGPHPPGMLNHATRQRKKEEESNGSLATALPTGALRSPLPKVEPSLELIKSKVVSRSEDHF